MIIANKHIKASLRGLFLHAIKFIMFKIQIIFFQARRLGLLSKKYNYDSVVQRWIIVHSLNSKHKDYSSDF